MTSKTEFSKPSATEIKVMRRFAGDRDTLWAMWTQAEHLRNWWGPKDYDTGLRSGFPSRRRLVLLHARSGWPALLRQDDLCGD